MNTATQNDRLIEETRRRIEADRKKLILYNMLMTLFICFVIAGLAGAVYFYIKLENVTGRLKDTNSKLETARLELQKAKSTAEHMKIVASNQNDVLADLIMKVKTALPANDAASKKITALLPAIDSITGLASRDSARAYARQAYDNLRKYDFREAMNLFNKSETTYPGYRDSYEVYTLLLRNADNLDDPKVQRRLLEEIYTVYNSLNRLKKSDIK
jgi:hypothetical protein